MRGVSKQEVEIELKKRLETASEKDVQEAVGRVAEVIKKVSESGVLRKELAKVKLLGYALKDYWNGKYREIPYGSIAAIAVAILYILNPVDLIPDVIPVVGQIDDAMVLSLVWKMVSEDVRQYAIWKINSADVAEKVKIERLYKETFGDRCCEVRISENSGKNLD